MNTTRLVLEDTPVQLHEIGGGWSVAVKREDLCSPAPGPQFSKMRGIVPHVESRPEDLIGVLDTYHSKAGWGVSQACRALGKKCVVFYPVYKGDAHGRLRENQEHCRSLGAHLMPVPAGMSAVLWHRARKVVEAGGGYMMPNALKTPDAVEANAREVGAVPPQFLTDTTWVVSVSSGTIAAGVLRGLERRGAMDVDLILHLGYSRPQQSVVDYVHRSAEVEPNGGGISITVIDEGYEYREGVVSTAPFPCNEYYDAKAWDWLRRHRADVGERVLFWNIGA